MKKTLAVILLLGCVSLFSACWSTNSVSIVTNKPLSPSPSVSPVISPSESALPNSSVPASETPFLTPTPTIRPAQTTSIVPTALLSAGYTTPVEDVPAGYTMPYYIEVDLSNQCVNIFIKNEQTGKYDVLLNRFICSSGSSTLPSPVGKYYIKTQAQQRAATSQNLKYERYYFKKYDSYAYYVTRYENEYMFHSFTFENVNGNIVPKKPAYYNMGNRGSAGCIRLLMNHAKWIFDNIDGGTYCVVTDAHTVNASLRSLLKKYLPPLGWDMLADYQPGSSKGLERIDLMDHPDTAPTPVPTPSPTPEITPSPTPSPSPTPTPEETPDVTPSSDPFEDPDTTPEEPSKTPTEPA